MKVQKISRGKKMGYKMLLKVPEIIPSLLVAGLVKKRVEELYTEVTYHWGSVNTIHKVYLLALLGELIKYWT